MAEENKDFKEDELEEVEEIEEEEVDLEDEAEEASEEVLGEEIIEKLEKEKEELTNQILRLQADFVNFRKRSEKDKQRTVNFALEGFVSKLLPIIDNFERALSSQEDKEDSFYKGVSLIYEEILKLLDANGVEELECLGEDFDPNKHHAVVMEESDDYDEGKVIEVLQTGYIMKDKVIRPAMVKVSQ